MPARKSSKEKEAEKEVVEPPTEDATQKAKAKKRASSASGVADSLKRGAALARLRKTMDVPCKPGELIPESTKLLQDGSCDLTVKDLMLNDSLSYEEAIRVMIQLRSEASGPSSVAIPGSCPNQSEPTAQNPKLIPSCLLETREARVRVSLREGPPRRKTSPVRRQRL